MYLTKQLLKVITDMTNGLMLISLLVSLFYFALNRCYCLRAAVVEVSQFCTHPLLQSLSFIQIPASCSYSITQSQQLLTHV